jgi:4-amino-4-deoxy-L-arabinose transferase-like glycosyltransferase
VTGATATAPAEAPSPEERLARGQAFLLTLPGVLLVAMTLLGLGLRLYRLDGRSLWLDELVTAWVTRFDSLWQVFDFLRYWPDNTPFIYVQAWLLRGLGGDEWAVRLPYAIEGALTVPAIYLLGRALWGRPVGLLAGLLMAVMPFAVWYSQEARSYAPLMLFTTLQALFAYRSATRSHPFDWFALALFTALNVYTIHLALGVTGALAAYIFLVLLADLLALRGRAVRERRAGLRRLAGRAGLGLAAAALVALAYLPWLPRFQEFMARRDLGFGLVPEGKAPSFADLYGRLYELSMLGPLLVAVMVGVVVCAVGLVRGRWREAALLFLWSVVPLAGYWVAVGPAMVQLAGRYYATIFPALVLFAALGVRGASVAVGRLVSRGHKAERGGARPWQRTVSRVVFAVLVAVLLVQAGTWTASAYALPKEDYRGAASYIREHSPSGGVVLALGAGKVVFFPESLQYYLDLWGAPVDVQDARMLDYTAASRIAMGGGAVWAVYYNQPSEEQLEQAQAQGLEVVKFHRVTLLRSTLAGSNADQARAILRWGSAWEPRLTSSMKLIDVLEGVANLGDDLLPPPSRTATAQSVGTMSVGWELPGSARVTEDGRAIVLLASGQELNARLALGDVLPGATYLLAFRCGGGAAEMSRQVFASVHNGDTWLDTFPTGTGYRCRDGDGVQGFAFTVPDEADALTIWLRATGTGSAEFSDVQLREIK